MPNPVPQHEYISVFDRTTGLSGQNFDTTAFNTNGTILNPSKCEITETLNGGYSVTLTHPTDKNNLWKSIYVLNFLKVQGQLFRIQTVDTNFDGSSSGSVTAYAEHITYLQNDAWVLEEDWYFQPLVVAGRDMQSLLESIEQASVPNGVANGSWKEGMNNRFPHFVFSSDVEIPSALYNPDPDYNDCYVADIGGGKTRYEMIMDAISRFGGELYRDNFYYSIKNRMENSIDNAFEIRLGSNLLGIKRTIDTSKFCTYYRGYYNLAQHSSLYAWAYANLDDIPFLNSIVRAKKYVYTDPGTGDYTIPDTLLNKDVDSYYSQNMNPKFTYTIKMKDVRKNPDFRLLSGIRFKVGDTGRIHDERLGITKTLKVIQTKTDGITGEVTEVTLDSSYDFDWGYGYATLPPMPEIPSRFDSTKIAVVLLDNNLQETETVTYFTWLPSVTSFLENNPNKNYDVIIGDDAGITSFENSQFATLLNLIRVQIPGSVEWIPANAFSGCYNLQEVTLKEGIEMIDVMAFAYCRSLTEIRIPDSVTTFYERVYPSVGGSIPMSGAFYNCENLGTVHLPENLTKIPAYTFYSCENLLSVSVPDEVSEVGRHAFEGCTSLHTLTLGESMLKLSESAFRGCTSLSSVTLNDGLTTLENEVFESCTSLQRITIPDTVTTVSRSPYGFQFNGCTSLREIRMSANIPTIPRCFLQGCELLERVTLPDAPDAVEQSAFRGCAKIREIVLPASVEEIGERAFENCTALAEIDIPMSVTAIGDSAFSYCESLTSIEIPTGVHTLGNNVFNACNSLQFITVHNVVYSISGDPWRATNFISTASKEDLERRGKPIPDGKYVVEWDGVSGSLIAPYALISFTGQNGNITAYDVKSTFGSIRNLCVANPDTMFRITLGDAFNMEAWEDSTVVPANCFSGLANVESVYIPSRFTEIETDAFSNCSGLEYIVIDKQKGSISGEPWGCPAGTDVYYTAYITDSNGENLTVDSGALSVRTQATATAYNTGLSGIDCVSQLPAQPQNKTLYIVKENNAFALKLGSKGVTL